MTEHRPKHGWTGEAAVCAVCQDWWPCPRAVAVTESKPTPAAAVEALRAARQWAHEHGHQQPDDRMLAAYGEIVAEHARAAERKRIADWLTDRSRDLRAEAVNLHHNPDPARPEAPRVRMAKALALAVAASDLRARRDTQPSA